MKIPREHYGEMSEGKSVPYCFEIKKQNQVLFYFGANHSHDLKNKQYPLLKKYWKKFLKTSNPLKLVAVEGGLRGLEVSEDEAILRGSEGSLVTLFAYEERIPVITPEPSRYFILKSLRKKFSERYIQYYYFAGLVDSWYRRNPRPQFTSYISAQMLWYIKRYDFKKFTLSEMKKIHRKLFKNSFDYKEQTFFNAITNPNQPGTVINKIARASSDMRDIAIIKQFQREWHAGRSLFVVYGSGHAFVQEEILRKTLK